MEVRGTISDFDLREGQAAEAAIPEPEPEPEPITEAVAINENDTWSLEGPVRSSNKKEKKKGKRTTWQ